MRGNHHILGRNDYVEPSPMPEAELHQICAVEVRLVEGKKTWKAAYLDGVHIGYVTTRLAGQSYRTLDMEKRIEFDTAVERLVRQFQVERHHVSQRIFELGYRMMLGNGISLKSTGNELLVALIPQRMLGRG